MVDMVDSKVGRSEYVVPYDSIRNDIIRNRLGNNLNNYIKNKIHVETVVKEAGYIDKDYLLDYSGYYSRSFQEVGRFTERIHLFSRQFTQDDFEEIIINNGLEDLKILKDSYQGFIIIKPFKDGDGNPTYHTGRTLLNIPKECLRKNNNKCIYYTTKVNLFGIPLEVKTLPFQTRDPAVAACATIALWMANNKMSELFQTPAFSLFEITAKATMLLESSRNFPPEGLSLKQMLSFIKNIGLDFNLINVIRHKSNCEHDEEYRYKYKNLIPIAVKAFLYANIPIIANLSLINTTKPGLPGLASHSVVISGYRSDSYGTITHLYVHDDNYGPYVQFSNASEYMDFCDLDCEWNKKYDEVIMEELVIPLYPKIRLDFNVVYENYIKLNRITQEEETHELYFTTINDYKTKLLNKNISNKIEFLKEPMPRFVWVIATLVKGSIVREDLYDAVSHYMRKIATIEFN